MKLTKQQKILAAVACLGVGAVAVDRVFLAPPQSASANAVADAAADAAIAAASPAERQAPAPPTPGDAEDRSSSLPSFASLTDRLAKASTSGPTLSQADPFRVPAEWAPKMTESVQTVQAVQSNSEKLLLEQFKLESTIRSIIQDKLEQLAVINGRALRMGDSINVRLGALPDGSERIEIYELISVASRSVVLQSTENGDQVTLRLPRVLE